MTSGGDPRQPAAVACLRMAEFRRPEENVAWARKIVAWTNEHLRDRDGLFFDRKRVDGTIDAVLQMALRGLVSRPA